MVGQVTVVAILMICQGALEIIMGLLLIVMSFFMAAVMEPAIQQQQQQLQQQQLQGPDMFPFQVVAGVYLGMGVAGLVPGVLRIIAGIRGLYFRGRTLGIISLIMGLLSIGTCYCSLTSIGVAVYGLIVYFNHDVSKAFAMAERGIEPLEIKRRYYSDPARFGFDDTPAHEGLWEEEEPPVREDRPYRQEPPERHDGGDQFFGEGFRPKN